jgi:hypothetical protein
MSTFTDHKGLVWTRSEDRLTIKCEDGRSVMGNVKMTDEHLISFAYMTPPTPDQSPEERIAELEAQVAALISKLST